MLIKNCKIGLGSDFKKKVERKADIFFSVGKLDPKQLQPGGLSLDSVVIHYLVDIISEAERKKYKSKLLRDHPQAPRSLNLTAVSVHCAKIQQNSHQSE